MFHKAIELKLLEGTSLEVAFQDGIVKRYDMGALFQKYPQLKQLEDRDLFLSGRMMGAYGIVWNDDLDIETETIYEDGVTVREERFVIHNASAHAVAAARAAAGISQKQLAALTGIDQQLFDEAAANGIINDAQKAMILHFLESPADYMTAFIKANPGFIDAEIAKGGKNKERAELAIEKGYC